MNRKILLLNLALLALLGTLGWMLRAHWQQARAEHLATLAKAPRVNAQLPPPAPVPPQPAVPANYLEVAQRMLFSKDRNPNVIIEAPPPPPPPKPEEPPPPRPVYFGQMGIGDPVAFLSGEKGAQKGFHVGEQVGPFTLVAFNSKTITFGWKDKTLEYPLSELKPKEPIAGQQAFVAPPPARAGSPGSLIGVSPSQTPILGIQNGEVRACVVEDKSPNGTVKDGYRKSIVPGPFGSSCQWEPIR